LGERFREIRGDFRLASSLFKGHILIVGNGG